MKKAKTPSVKYMARAQALADAIDIAIPLYRPMTAAERRTVVNHQTDEEYVADLQKFALEIKQWALSPEPPFANLRSLAYHEEAFFTSWNEGAGAEVEQFWQQVGERGLPFERKDIIRDTLERGRIKNEMEYHTVVDSLVILQQIGKITADEADRLSQMLGTFESKIRKRRGR